MAVEIDAVLARYLRTGYAGVEVVVGNAVQLELLLAEHQLPAVDAVVSGLPWALIDTNVQRAIVHATLAAARGCFTTFAYLPALPMSRARQFQTLLNEVFDEVLTTRTVW